MSAQHTSRPLTAAMRRELESLASTGALTGWEDWNCMNGLWFHARDRVIGALARRGLIEATPDWTLTDSGRDAIAKANGASA